MRITDDEKLMYRVMEAIYVSGLPVGFKGAMVLKACLTEAGFSGDTRHTSDIDASWNTDDLPTGEQMAESIQRALRNNNIPLDVKLYRMFGENKTAGFDVIDPITSDTLFTMDIEVNRPSQQMKHYIIDGMSFNGISPTQIMADKIAVVSSDLVFRRIKDVIDLYYMSSVFNCDKQAIIEALSSRGRSVGGFNAFIKHSEDLQHAYDKYRFAKDVIKPPFDVVYNTVKDFLGNLMPSEKEKDIDKDMDLER